MLIGTNLDEYTYVDTKGDTFKLNTRTIAESRRRRLGNVARRVLCSGSALAGRQRPDLASGLDAHPVKDSRSRSRSGGLPWLPWFSSN